MIHLELITGGAGTGKSHTLKEMVANDTSRNVVVAPTGIAAMNCGGITIHSAFKVDPGNGFVSPSIKYGPLRGIETIYIDEVSMVSSDLLQSVITAADMLGATRIIAFGDLAQLKPVKGNWFFELREPDDIKRLTTIYRQADDKEFADILGRIRSNCHNAADMDYINRGKGDSQQGVTLAYSNATVDAINTQSLANIDSPIIENAADVQGDIKTSDVPAPEVLKIKPGASVIMLNNDKEKRWRNGTRGVVHEIKDSKYDEEMPVIVVNIDDNLYNVNEHTWFKRVPRKLTPQRIEYWESVASGMREMSFIERLLVDERTREHERAYAKHVLTNGYELEQIGSFTQFPMKLGYASTVHKSQGLTLDKVILKPDGFGTMHGLGYVALSRLTTLGGLTTFRKLRRDDFICNAKVLPWL